MNLDQLSKKVEWLEGQKRESDKLVKTLTQAISKLEKTLAKDKANSDALTDKVNKQEKEIRKIERINQLLKDEKAATKKSFTDLEKKLRAEEQSGKQTILEDQQKIEKELLAIREEQGLISSLQAKIRQQAEVDNSFDGRIENVEQDMKEILAGETAREELASSLAENRKTNDQRISEALGLLDAVNERMDSITQIELDQSRLSSKFEKMESAHQSSLEQQRSFIDSEKGKQLEQEKTWARREDRFASIEKLSTEVDKRLEELESIDIAVNRAQERFDQLIEKINRRVNELTEVQRLGEQRFRKEWTTFQADSEKRWTSQALNQEELQLEASRRREKMAKQITQIESRLADLDERLDHVGEQSDQFLQLMLESVRSVLSENERYEQSLR